VAGSTGPVLAAGAITVANRTVVNSQPIDWRVPVATGLLAGALSLLEKLAPKPVVAMSWVVLGTVLLTRVDPRTPSPVESFLTWWDG
jgi:hypothetical protein